MCVRRSRVVSVPAGCFARCLSCTFLSFVRLVCDTPGCWFAMRCFRVFPTVFRYAMASAARFFRVFDTPGDTLFFNGLHGVCGRSICVDRQGRVSLHLAAQHGGSAPEVRDGLLVWWWFENSRAYLYYFFIVNDCQFIVRSFASGREALKDGEVFVRCAFPYKAIVNFLVFESHMLAFCKVFCGGFDSGSG